MNGPGKNKMVGNAYARQALLPAGFRDQLYPAVENEFSVVRSLLSQISLNGYDRVSPPLVEYEDSLLIGPGEANGNQMFRLMDPDTQRVMAVRADMTVQISRLAATRLKHAERPLRLAYAGNVLRVKGSQVRPSRQFMQVGLELIGNSGASGTVEVISIAVEALSTVGIKDLSVDLTIAPIISSLIDAYSLSGDALDKTLDALSAKDVCGFEHLPTEQAAVFIGLIAAAGDAGDALDMLDDLDMPEASKKLVNALNSVVESLSTRLPSLSLTVDPSETHGFEYKSGVGFAVFAKGAKSELGRGGDYQVVHADGMQENATGFSVYMDTLMTAVPEQETQDKVFVPADVSLATVKSLHEQGIRTIQGLTEVTDTSKEAARLGCSHVFKDGSVQKL